MSFTVFPSQPMDLTIRIRSDASITHGVQLVCNGSLQDPALEQGYLRVSNVWRPGDTIELRYGIPFAVHASSARPLRRSYPGASTSCQAVVFHGARALGLADRSSPGIPSADQRCISIGVRKDGVLLLRPQSLGDISPFQRPGDLFMGMSEHDQPLASVSLEGSLVLMTPLIHSYDVNYVSFETVFDRGTA
jgi:hypothetical protein